MKAGRAPEAWYRDARARRFLARGYLPGLLLLSLAWELAQLPLYTIWREASAGYIAFSVAHCTAGDLLVGTAAFVLALSLQPAGPLEQWRWARLALATMLIGVVYALFSEWMNTALGRWTYSELMPTLRLGGVGIGLSPLVQWLIVPPLALYAGRKTMRLH